MVVPGNKKYYLKSDMGYLIGPFNTRVEAITWHNEAQHGLLPASDDLKKWIEESGDPDFISSIEGGLEAGDFVPDVLCTVDFYHGREEG
jgi:hypothetical protein